jgi:hypothetical protein
MPDPHHELTTPEAEAEAGLVAARETHGPEWPAWLSMTSIEPETEPEAFL